MAIAEYATPKVQVKDVVELTRVSRHDAQTHVYYIVSVKPLLFGTDVPGKRFPILQPNLLQYTGPNHWQYTGTLMFDAVITIGADRFTYHSLVAVSEEQARRLAIGEIGRKYNLLPSAANALVSRPNNSIQIVFHS